MTATDHEHTCNCEHADHDAGTAHPMFAAPLGTDARRASYVGMVCGDCARGHLAGYLIEAAAS